METIAKYYNAYSSAQKIRLIVPLIIGKKVSKALQILTFTNKKAAKIIKKVLDSAIANAEHNNNLDIDNLKIVKILVDVGINRKRIMLRAKRRVDNILKRTSHVTVIISDS